MKIIVDKGPLRSVRWRSDYVLYLLAHRPRPLPLHSNDDSYTRCYYHVAREMKKAAENGREFARVSEKHPIISQAHRIYFDNDSGYRELIEAWLLTRESFAEIGARLGLDERVIKYYEALFFDVRDRLHQTTWVRKIIMDPITLECRRQRTISEHLQRRLLYRMFAYFGGRVALEAAICGVSTLIPPRDPTKLSSWYSSLVQQLVQFRAIVAAGSTASDPQVSVGVRAALQVAASAKENPQSDVVDLVGRLLQMMVKYRRPGEPREYNEAQKQFLNSPVEPRVDEQMALANGIVPPSLAQAAARVDLTRLAGGRSQSTETGDNE